MPYKLNFNVLLIKNGIKKIYYNFGVLAPLWLNCYLF
jgi:hypothetical protein